MIRRILLAIDVAVLTTAAYALTAADCWPPTAAAHLALVRAGVVTGAVGPYYPVWGWCVAQFGLNAVTLSALAGGCAAGLLMWNVARIKGVRGGLVSAAIFAFAPTVWRAGTQVDSSLFDLSFLLLALAFAGGKRWKLKMPIALLAAGTAFFDIAAAGYARPLTLALGGTLLVAVAAALAGVAFAFSLKGRRGALRWALIGLTAIALFVVPTLGAMAVAHPEGALADAAAQEILRKVGPDTKWLVSDGVLEDAFARRLALADARPKPFLVCTAHAFDECYLTNLVRRAAEAYPGDVQLRSAAALGVRAFLEELPFADTNGAAVVFAWGRGLWTKDELADVAARLERVMDGGRDPLCGYVRERLERISEPPVRPQERRVPASAVNALVDGFGENAGEMDSGQLRERAREIVRADRMNPLGNAVLGTLAAWEGQDDVAEFHLRRAVARGNAPPLVYNDLAETLRRRRKFQEAEAAARKALALSPGNWRILETLADILQSDGASHEDVEVVLGKAEELAKEVKTETKATLLYLRAVECLRTGQEARANMLIRRLMRLPISEYLRRRVKLTAQTESR